MRFNNKQTQLTEEVLNKLSPYVRRELMDFIEQIPFVQNLTNINRPTLKTVERDKKGRVKVDLTNPHILEDMNYFRQAALHYKQHGCYTTAFRSKHPNSEYRQYWDEEQRRCREGLVREDGEWISGYNYFYWNYAPILLVEDKEFDQDKINNIIDDLEEQLIQAERVEDFPEPWDGDYLFFHYIEQAQRAGLYGVVLKTRGRGYSFKCQSMLSRNYNHIKRSKSYAIASESEFLVKDGILNKAWDNLSFINQNTAWSKRRQKVDREMHKKASYLDLSKGQDVEKGYLSEIIGVTLKNDPNKARGKRGQLILFEEAGQFTGLLTAWGIARPSMEQGRSTFGMMIAFGTGGSATHDFEGLETLFYSPEGYRVYSMPNVFDKNAIKSRCAFYHGEYLNRSGCYDKDGNSDVIKALIQVFQDREVVIKSTKDPNAIVQEKADRSITPQEACMRTEGNLFPVADLKDYLSDIMPNLDKFVSGHLIGRLGLDSVGDPKFMPDNFVSVIREFPIKDNKNKYGAIEIFTPPQTQGDGKVPSYRYIAGIDSYDRDESTTDSLGSIIVFDTWTEQIVAEYTGRPEFATDFYEICFRLIKFYNAIANFENMNTGIYTYFKNKGCSYLFCDTPEVLKSMELSKGGGIGNTGKGTPPTKGINAWGRRLQSEWMRKVTASEDIDDFTPNLRKIRSVGYIKECIAWHIDINADRVSAMNMVMILWKELEQIIENSFSEDEETNLDEDPFFMQNYGSVSNKYFANYHPDHGLKH